MYFNFQFLVEDPSGTLLIEEIMKKIKALNPDIEYKCWSFHGIGGFTKKNTVKETKTGKLLNDLATRLRAYSKSLAHVPAAVIVVLDNDDNVTDDFYKELYQVAENNRVTVDYAFCIAIEEVEAWLLGDEQAIVRAYPGANLNILHAYVQDSICGTWERLADVVYRGGLDRLYKDGEHPGKLKSEWAMNIGQYMDLENNKSPSFQHFLSEIQQRIPKAS